MQLATSYGIRGLLVTHPKIWINTMSYSAVPVNTKLKQRELFHVNTILCPLVRVNREEVLGTSNLFVLIVLRSYTYTEVLL